MRRSRRGRRSPAADPELVVDRAHVGLHGVDRHRELRPDLLQGEQRRQQREDRTFPEGVATGPQTGPSRPARARRTDPAASNPPKCCTSRLRTTQRVLCERPDGGEWFRAPKRLAQDLAGRGALVGERGLQRPGLDPHGGEQGTERPSTTSCTARAPGRPALTEHGSGRRAGPPARGSGSSSSIPTSDIEPARAPIAAPTAIPSSGTKNSSPKHPLAAGSA
jgi:hypothetical protein